MKTAAACLFAFLLLACASRPADSVQPLQIEGMVIENQTEMWVSAARLLVPVSGNFVSCGNIAPGSMCATTFPGSGYEGYPVEITWSQGGQIHSTGEFVMDIPDETDMGRPAAVRIVIAGPGSAGAVIVQRPE